MPISSEIYTFAGENEKTSSIHRSIGCVKGKEMIGISEMQFGGMLTTVLLALTVAFQLPRRAMRNKVFGRARWLMAGGLALIAAQFLLQYIGGD